jgi:hypothetical protein
MKKTFFVLVIALLCIAGCSDFKQTSKGLKSSFIGLNRRVILYTNNGSVINTWEGKINVKTDKGVMRILLPTNKILYLSGTYIIEEI